MGRIKPRRRYRPRRAVPIDGYEIYIPKGRYEREATKEFYRRWYGYCPVEKRNVTPDEVGHG